jgi:hypothetical protein
MMVEKYFAFSWFSRSISLKWIVRDGFLGFFVNLIISSILGTPRVTLDLLETPLK